jgi:hypothetical protein
VAGHQRRHTHRLLVGLIILGWAFALAQLLTINTIGKLWTFAALGNSNGRQKESFLSRAAIHYFCGLQPQRRSAFSINGSGVELSHFRRRASSR